MITNSIRIILLCFFSLIMTGCSDNELLYSALSEKDYNDMSYVLSKNNIETSKDVDKTGVLLYVRKTDSENAIKILRDNNLPRKNKDSLGGIFKKDGLLSSPIEEKARYVYALSQEVESTLEKIDGVIIAKVHVVLPERIFPGEPAIPASASVFIKHNRTLDPDLVEEGIRKIISTSIPGLSIKNKERISVVFSKGNEYELLNINKTTKKNRIFIPLDILIIALLILIFFFVIISRRGGIGHLIKNKKGSGNE
ncbi:type III secretion protein J [Kluyvera sp. 1366]